MKDLVAVTIRRGLKPAHSEPAFAKGGHLSAASKVKSAGRMGDDMVVHINKREFEEMRGRWGEPTINPDTGLPEFFLGGLLDGIGDAVSGAWDWVKDGGWQALAGAGLGALTGGPLGALTGGLGGLGGKNNSAGAEAVLGDAGGGLYGAGAGQTSSKGGGGFANLLPALGGIAAALGQGLTKDKTAEAAAKREQQSQVQFNQPLPEYTYNREYVGYQPVDYTQEGERQQFSGNQLAFGGQPVMGALSAPERPHPTRDGTPYVSGPSNGRKDDVDAKLSMGEYVLDSEVVSMLGDGNNEAGAQRLDEMRQTIRKHKGAALAQGQMSPNAAHPLQYLGMQ